MSATHGSPRHLPQTHFAFVTGEAARVPPPGKPAPIWSFVDFAHRSASVGNRNVAMPCAAWKWAHAAASATTPAATTIAAARRFRHGRSPSNTTPISAAITTLDSRTAETAPIGAIVLA